MAFDMVTEGLRAIALPLDIAFQFRSPGVGFSLGPLTIRWYGLLIASAVLIGVTLSQYLAERRRVDPNAIGDLSIWLVLAAIPCARLYYVAFEWPSYADRPGEIIAIWKGGIAIHGAILGGAIAALIFARLRRIPFWQLADLVAPSLILGQAIGRWGNFFNSEAFGAPTNLPWKLYIPLRNRPVEYSGFDYFHPTFLYESLWNVMVFGLLMVIFFRSTKPNSRIPIGTVALTYMWAYSLGRIWIEGLRTDSLVFGELRIAQLVSLTGILAGFAGLFWVYRLGRSLPDVVPHTAEKSESNPN